MQAYIIWSTSRKKLQEIENGTRSWPVKIDGFDFSRRNHDCGNEIWSRFADKWGIAQISETEIEIEEEA